MKTSIRNFTIALINRYTGLPIWESRPLTKKEAFDAFGKFIPTEGDKHEIIILDRDTIIHRK